MKNSRKLALLGACALSSLALVGCNSDNSPTLTVVKFNNAWIITEVGKNDVLFDAKDISYWRSGDPIQFTASYDNKNYYASEFFIFDHDNKPPRALYDVEYGTKEWNDLYNTTANYSNVEENNL